MTEVPLRLFFWCERFFAVGGAQVALQRQIRELLRRGHQVTVGSLDRDGPLSFPDGAPLPGFHHTHLRGVKDIYAIMGAPAGPPYDAMYVQRLFESDPLAQLRALGRLAPSIPTLIRVTTVGDLAQMAHLSPGPYLSRVAGFIVLNEAQADEVREHVTSPVIFRQRNGLPPGELEPGRFSDSGPFVFIGRRSPSKGIDVLVQAWQAYRLAGGQRGLEIIGPPKEGYPVPALEDRGWLLEWGVKVRPGGAGVWPSLERAYALVRPSRAEGHCNTMLEAMAAGIPVLAADIPGLAGDIRASRAGWLFAVEDPGALAEVLARADADPDGVAAMAARGPGFISTERTLEHTVDRLLQALNQVLGQAVARRSGP